MAIDQRQKERPESPMDKRKAMHLCYGYVGHEGARQPLNCDVENLFLSFKLTDMLLFSSSNENRNSFCILSVHPFSTVKVLCFCTRIGTMWWLGLLIAASCSTAHASALLFNLIEVHSMLGLKHLWQRLGKGQSTLASPW